MELLKNSGKQSKIGVFMGGILTAVLLSVILLFGGFSGLDVSQLGNALMAFLIVGAAFAVPFFLIHFIFEKIESKSNWKYLAFTVLLFLGISFAYMIASLAGVTWGLVYAGLLLFLPLFRERRFTDKKTNLIALESGLVGAGVVWKLVEAIRGGAIYSILAVEWLFAVIAGIFLDKKVVVFAIITVTAIFLWFTAMMNPCSFSEYLRW